MPLRRADLALHEGAAQRRVRAERRVDPARRRNLSAIRAAACAGECGVDDARDARAPRSDQRTAGGRGDLSIFAAGYLARPLGGVIMAHFGDRDGRKRMAWSVRSRRSKSE
ncbi:hypothetical protein PT2222_20171 [Paraburkholderia tropica]